MAFGKHRRKSDSQPGDAGRYEELTPEQKAKAFEGQASRSAMRAADKRLKKQQPYDLEPEKPKGRGLFGKKKK
jgi:hypothetical protein